MPLMGQAILIQTKDQYVRQFNLPLQQCLQKHPGHTKLTEDNIKEALREVRLALLEADVALPVVKEFVNNVKEKASVRKWRAA